MSYKNTLPCMHNARCRYTHGYYCEDCGDFINKGTLEYFMTEGVIDIWMAIHNRSTEYKLNEKLTDLKESLFDKNYLNSLNEAGAIEFRKNVYDILGRHGILDNEATVELK